MNRIFSLKDCNFLPLNEFQEKITEHLSKGDTTNAYFAFNFNKMPHLACILCSSTGMITPLFSKGPTSCPSLTPDFPSLHLFERETFEQYGITHIGHPWPKPVRFEKPFDSNEPCRYNFNNPDKYFFKVEGEDIHEVAVGPVHAGIIEPGHFRFQCHGEEVLHLEIMLGYQHRGIEKILIGGPDNKALPIMETIAGDTTIAHTTAYCEILESLSQTLIPQEIKNFRRVMLELERLANHTGDLGAMAGDVGYLPTSSFCGRIRGDYLNLSAFFCGSRFGRSMIVPGGVQWGFPTGKKKEFLANLEVIAKDTMGAINLLFNDPIILSRFERNGVVTRTEASALGLVGVSARASSLFCDVRKFEDPHFNPRVCDSGDVFARAKVRALEIESSINIIKNLVSDLPEGTLSTPEISALSPSSLSVSLVEGWRGEVCHVAITDENGKFLRYKIVDPSFHNWFGLSFALRGGTISDFPLNNKSFNLSYCGHDL